MMKKYIFFIGLFFIAVLSRGQGLKADGKKIINSSGQEVLLRGMGPGGWQIMEGYMMTTSGFAGSQHEIKSKLIALMGETNTETFFTKWRENHFTKRDVDSLAAWGFNSIRIPMHYNLFTLPIEEEPIPGQSTWNETGFDLINNVLAWAAPHNMYVILDMHATPGGQGRGSEINDYDPSKPSLWESQANKNKLVALWARIADRYKDNPWIGGYDLINETHWDLPGNVDLMNLYQDITKEIRKVDNKHILFIEGNSYANDHSGLTPPWDPNLVYSFHKYWNTNKPEDLDWILPLREKHNVPLWMGESGENSNTWFTDAISLFEKNKICWAWWTMRKIGDIDSPYAVDINPGYQKVINYWKGEGPKPTSQETFDGMMKLTENLLVQNSQYRKDVPDAMIRQVQTDETKPYKGKPAVIPGIVYASDFDLGKNNFAYYDTDVADYNLSTGEYQAWNRGWAYRNDGVDIEKNNDNINSNGYNIGFVNKGEWTKYTVNVDEKAVYKAIVRVASQETGGGFFLSVDDQEVTKNQTVSSTAGWSKFAMMEIPDLIFTQGKHSLKLHFSNDIPFNISSIEFVKTGSVSSLELNALNGKTGQDEKSVEIAISEAVLETSLVGSLSQFKVFINNEEKVVKSIVKDLLRNRIIILTLDKHILKGDKVTVSYTGTSIQSETNKTLNTFSDLVVNNESPDRVIIPGLVEVENFDYMVGMGIENSTDVGGGKNFGYTDPGDYADYSIYVPKTGNYSVGFRVAGYNKGKIGLYSVAKNGVETELIVASTVITNGWQTWQTVTENLSIQEGPHKLRMRILEGGFNFNWMEFGKPDSDKDGVLDDVDLCPNTPLNSIVDVTGCPIFALPSNNYALTISSKTCRSENNGSISIAAVANYSYSVTLVGDHFSETKTFNSNVKFTNLSAGSYTACITIIGNSSYKQCFTVSVTQPDILSVTTNKSANATNVKISLAGAELYYVTLNAETFITKESEIELVLAKGINDLMVQTDKGCQGTFKERIVINNEPYIFPNPIVDSVLNINCDDFYGTVIPVEIFDLSGKVIFSKTYSSSSNQLSINVASLLKGTYILKVTCKGTVFNYKIIK
jgi:hypothetical protein